MAIIKQSTMREQLQSRKIHKLEQDNRQLETVRKELLEEIAVLRAENKKLRGLKKWAL